MDVVFQCSLGLAEIYWQEIGREVAILTKHGMNQNAKIAACLQRYLA